MTIKILSAKEFATKLKATIQASGRLGFTGETAIALNLKAGKFAKFSKPEKCLAPHSKESNGGVSTPVG